MQKEVDVAIIGAGTAGLYALSQVRRKTDSFVIINDGPYGTTCARVGCMPSKSLIQIAKYYHEKRHFEISGIKNSDQLEVSIPEVLKRVREQRDFFVEHTIGNTTARLGEKSISGKAEFVNATTLKVGNDEIVAKKIIIATGSTPVYEPQWKEMKEHILTSDELFEQDDLPPTMGIIGLGVIGLELGQALSRLGIHVTAVHSKPFIGGLTDPQVNDAMLALCRQEFDIWQGSEDAVLSKEKEQIKITQNGREVLVDKVLVSVGRRPNLAGLKLENAGVSLDAKGLPDFDPQTMQIENLPIYLSGDVNTDRPLQHEAADEGRIAGYNAVNEVKAFQRKVPFSIVFTDPNIGFIGKSYDAIKADENIVIGSYDFTKQTRAMIMNANKGIANLYVDKRDGKVLGAEIAVPGGEYLAHHLAWCIEQEMSVYDMVQLPFYHPTLEEGLYALLLDCAKKLNLKKKRVLEVPFADE